MAGGTLTKKEYRRRDEPFFNYYCKEFDVTNVRVYGALQTVLRIFPHFSSDLIPASSACGNSATARTSRNQKAAAGEKGRVTDDD